jgi:Trp operon repressor
MAAAAPVLVHVLGDVDEMREVAERADDIERLRDGEVGQQRVELALDAGASSAIRAPEADGGLPDRFDRA